MWSFKINVCNQATAHLPPPPLHNSQLKKTSYRVNVSLGEGKVCRRCLVTDIYLRFHYWWAFHFQSMTCGSWDLFFRQNSNEYKVLIQWILLSPEWWVRNSWTNSIFLREISKKKNIHTGEIPVLTEIFGYISCLKLKGGWCSELAIYFRIHKIFCNLRQWHWIFFQLGFFLIYFNFLIVLLVL